MNILGINCFSCDTSACLICDGKIVAFAEEERFNRDKHTKAFPFTAIEYCFKEGGIEAKDLDYVAFSFNPKLDFKRGFRDFRYHPRTYKRFAGQVYFDYKLSKKANIFRRNFHYNGTIVFVSHHRAHAASSYFVSPFNEAAVLSIDSGGDYVSTMMGIAKDNKLTVLRKIYNPHSLGLVYSCVTKFLGFEPNDGEGKVMELASYGTDLLYEDILKMVVPKPGFFKVNLKYFRYHLDGSYNVSRKFKRLLGEPREPEDVLIDHYKNIAFSIQKLTEERAVDLSSWLYEQTGMPNLCISGDLGLNSVMNTSIAERTPFQNIFIQPAANDSGTSIGAALYVWHCQLGNPKEKFIFNPYLGPKYSNGHIERVITDRFLKYKKISNPSRIAAKLLADNKIIGWFQGRMEAGRRGLGNRSILANPCGKDTKDIINARVKFRESFRPFALSVKEDKARQYFKNYRPSPYMLLVQDIIWHKQKEIPAVCHVDGTGWLQTVDRRLNPMYWKLIDNFEKLTGVPVVLNTSFNIKGEPLVCNPRDAVNCFAGARLDALVIGNYLVEK